MASALPLSLWLAIILGPLFLLDILLLACYLRKRSRRKAARPPSPPPPSAQERSLQQELEEEAQRERESRTIQLVAGDTLITEYAHGQNMLMDLDFEFDALDLHAAPQPRIFSPPPPKTPPLPERARRGVLLGSEIEARWMARAQVEQEEKKRRAAAAQRAAASNRACASDFLLLQRLEQEAAAASTVHETELQEGSCRKAVAFAEVSPRESRRTSRQASRPPQIMPGPSHAVRIAH